MIIDVALSLADGSRRERVAAELAGAAARRRGSGGADRAVERRRPRTDGRGGIRRPARLGRAPRRRPASETRGAQDRPDQPRHAARRWASPSRTSASSGARGSSVPTAARWRSRSRRSSSRGSRGSSRSCSARPRRAGGRPRPTSGGDGRGRPRARDRRQPDRRLAHPARRHDRRQRLLRRVRHRRMVGGSATAICARCVSTCSRAPRWSRASWEAVLGSPARRSPGSPTASTRSDRDRGGDIVLSGSFGPAIRHASARRSRSPWRAASRSA